MDAAGDSKSRKRDSCQALVVGITNIPSPSPGVLSPVSLVADISKTALAVVRSIGCQLKGDAEMESMEGR